MTAHQKALIHEAIGYLSDYSDEMYADAERHDIDDDGAEKDLYRAGAIRRIVQGLTELQHEPGQIIIDRRAAQVLKAQFPWLGTDEDAGSGADVIATLVDIYEGLRGIS